MAGTKKLRPSPRDVRYQRDPALRNIFAGLKSLLKPYARTLTRTRDDDRRYELWSKKPVEIGGRKKDSVFFASVIIQKDYVGFYFMPVYAEPEIKRLFSPGLLKLLKGKSCFHFKWIDSRLMEEMRDALKNGFELYIRRGWI